MYTETIGRCWNCLINAFCFYVLNKLTTNIFVYKVYKKICANMQNFSVYY